MYPDSNQIQLAVAIESVHLVQSLDHFGHVPQIEHVVAFSRDRQEIVRHSSVDVDGGNGERFGQWFDFLVKL